MISHIRICIVLMLLGLIIFPVIIFSEEPTYIYGEEGNCGNDCVVQILHKFGIPIHPENLVRLTQDHTRNGNKIITFYDMVLVFEALGLKAEGFTIDIDSLRKMPGLIICHYGENHFVVIEKIEEGKIQIFNPPWKIESIPMKQFNSKWDGNVLVVNRNQNATFNTVYPPGPEIFTDVKFVDWGTLNRDGIVPFNWDIWNLGEDALIIKSTHATCNCTSWTLEKETIFPGEKATLHAEVNIVGKYGKDKIVINVLSNCVRTPELRLEMTGEVIRTLESLPASINLGMIPVGEKKIRMIAFRGSGLKTELISDIKFSSNNMKHDRMNYYYDEVNYAGFDFEVNWINHPGPFKEYITVSFHKGIFEDVVIPLEGVYQSPVRLENNAAFLELGKQNRYIRGKIQLFVDKPAIQICHVQSVESSLNFLELSVKKNAYGYLIRFKGKITDNEKLPDDGEIRIKGDKIPIECQTIKLFFITRGG